jgi:hypothetical protein
MFAINYALRLSPNIPKGSCLETWQLLRYPNIVPGPGSYLLKRCRWRRCRVITSWFIKIDKFCPKMKLYQLGRFTLKLADMPTLKLLNRRLRLTKHQMRTNLCSFENFTRFQ